MITTVWVGSFMLSQNCNYQVYDKNARMYVSHDTKWLRQSSFFFRENVMWKFLSTCVWMESLTVSVTVILERRQTFGC